jgi:serine/threonine-protein kinase
MEGWGGMEPGELIADKYRLERVLGEGGMGTVYAATNAFTGKPVAIKCLHADLTENEDYTTRFLREAQVAGRIDHPNVVNIFDVGRHGSHIFLVMELLQGETLGARLERGPQDPVSFIQLMLPVLRGVHAAHRIGVTHRDLKPDNIFLPRGPDGEFREAKVLDFGISKMSEEIASAGRKQLTIEGTIFGTPHYMAPEQIRNARNTDARSDVYALGVIFYRALSGELPFDSETLPGLALRIVEGNAVPITDLCPDLDRELGDAIMRTLSVDPQHRFASVAAFGQALEPFAGGYTFATNPGGSWIELGAASLSGDVRARTPSFGRAVGQRTPASQPRMAVEAAGPSAPTLDAESAREPSTPGRVASGAELPQRSSSAPTPAGQKWQHARKPALGLVALVLVLGGMSVWLVAAQLKRPPTTTHGADEVSAQVPAVTPAAVPEPAPAVAVLPEVADAAVEPAAERAALAEPPQEPGVGPEQASEPEQISGETMEPRPRRLRRAARPAASEAREASKVAEPAPTAEVQRAEPAPKPEPQALPALNGSDSNPYLRR